jgi:hypothetical protein
MSLIVTVATATIARRATATDQGSDRSSTDCSTADQYRPVERQDQDNSDPSALSRSPIV